MLALYRSNGNNPRIVDHGIVINTDDVRVSHLDSVNSIASGLDGVSVLERFPESHIMCSVLTCIIQR